ncbi:hypothetical protein HZA56_18380 [Candidatus Poribacteria bacterium]|nr:hypothetical protein [Candidatus Poribacteria bacterium]
MKTNMTNVRCAILLLNGRVYYRTGAPWFRSDIGITGDTIAAIVALKNTTAALVIDCSNLAISPDFIDSHSHSDLMVFDDPPQHPKGIHHVFVNGQHVVREGRLLSAGTGRVLRNSRQGTPKAGSS